MKIMSKLQKCIIVFTFICSNLLHVNVVKIFQVRKNIYIYIFLTYLTRICVYCCSYKVHIVFCMCKCAYMHACMYMMCALKFACNKVLMIESIEAEEGYGDSKRKKQRKLTSVRLGITMQPICWNCSTYCDLDKEKNFTLIGSAAFVCVWHLSIHFIGLVVSKWRTFA